MKLLKILSEIKSVPPNRLLLKVSNRDPNIFHLISDYSIVCHKIGDVYNFEFDKVLYGGISRYKKLKMILDDRHIPYDDPEHLPTFNIIRINEKYVKIV